MARILVIDDTPLFLTLCRTVLEEAGHEVEVTGDGADGVRRHRGRPADVVACDLAVRRGKLLGARGGGPEVEAMRPKLPNLFLLLVALQIVVAEQPPGSSQSGWQRRPASRRQEVFPLALRHRAQLFKQARPSQTLPSHLLPPRSFPFLRLPARRERAAHRPSGPELLYLLMSFQR
jgi:hypothetical protein